MDPWKLWFVLLLPSSFSSDSKASRDPLMKIISEQPDFTPVCSNETAKVVGIVCYNSTEMSRGEQCRLLYRYHQGFEHDCDSRFRLVTVNQTVLLRLNNLAAADSGIFSCECSNAEGTHTLHLNITVQETENTTGSTETFFPETVTGLILLLIIVSGLVLGVFCRSFYHHRRRQVPITIHQQPEPADSEPYSVFMQESVLYLTNVRSCTATTYVKDETSPGTLV